MLELIKLRTTSKDDLETLFLFQTDTESVWMAAFTPKNPNDKEAYLSKWTAIINNPDICMKTILLEDTVIGSVIHFDMMGETNISYWLDRNHWGKGIATEALKRFIQATKKKPLHARVAFDNFGSQKVLEKCGFVSIGEEQGFANARQKEIKEFVYKYSL